MDHRACEYQQVLSCCQISCVHTCMCVCMCIHAYLLTCTSVYSQIPKQLQPLEVHLIDAEAARQRQQQFSLTSDEMAAHQQKLRSHRSVRYTSSSFFSRSTTSFLSLVRSRRA